MRFAYCALGATLRKVRCCRSSGGERMSWGTAIWGVLFAAIGWIVLEFIGKPLRQFFELRSEAIQILTEYDDPPSYERSDRADAFLETKRQLRVIGSKLIAYEQSHSLVARLLGW